MSMRFGDFVWPNDPKTYTLREKKKTVEHPIVGGGFLVEEVGKQAAELVGEGEFFGEGAYATFRKLLREFQKGGEAILVHPMWEGGKARFTELTLGEEPRRDYVKYRFCFCEAADADTAVTMENMGAVVSAGAAAKSARQYYTVRTGDTLWAISRKYGMALSDLLKLNPQIANPNYIVTGQQVRVV